MKPPKKLNLFILLAFVLIQVLFTSCYEEVDGCLDVLSTNYEVTADKSVDSLCTYPNLNFSIEYIYGDTTMRRSVIFENDLGSAFGVISASSLFSGISLVSSTNEFVILDSVYFDYYNNGETVKLGTEDTYGLTGLGRSAVSFPNFKMPGDYGLMQFVLGMGQLENQIDTSSLEGESKLSNLIEGYYNGVDTGFLQQQLRFVRDSLNTDTLSINWYGSDMIEQFDFDIQQEAIIRQDLEIILEWDYYTWVEGINFQSDDLVSIKDKLNQNLRNSIRLKE